jgi:acyl-CoA synthetase (NDP forming)
VSAQRLDLPTAEPVHAPEAVSSGLRALFQPRSIAFLGASERPNTPASRGLRNCLRHGFKGSLYPVNPKYQELFGTRCYASLSDLPEIPEMVMIGLGAEMTLEAVATCRDAGVKVVVACSAGWEEQGPEGQARADRLRELIDGASMRLLGPNCLGAGNPAAGFSLGYNSSFESLRHARAGRVALVTQSGAMMGGLLLNAEDASAEVGLYAHVGNAMDIGMEEIVEHLVDDPQVEVIALMIEGLRQPARFVEAARRARAARKPLVVFKAGTSELGKQAVMSHTGALAGSDEVFSAVCREQGILRVQESEDLMPAAALLSRWKHKAPVGGTGLLVFTLSGGAASILADECAAAQVPLPKLSRQTLERLEALLPSYVKADNPLDVGGAVFSDPELPRHAMAIALEDPAVESVLWVGVGAPRDERSCLWLDQAIDVLQASPKTGALIPVSGYPQEAGFDRARDAGVPVFRSLRVAARLIGLARSWSRPVVPQGEPGRDMPALPKEGRVIDELRSKALLAELGIPVPASRVARTVDEVAGCARELGGTVVVKALAEGVMHKSELGLVALGLTTGEAAEAAARDMLARSTQLQFHGFLVERMAPRGVEVVLGIHRDPAFGPVLMFGLGGISVELFKDVAFATCPISPEGASELIGMTRAAALLRGFRGAPHADEAALVEAMVRVSQFAAYHRDELAEMDLNPVIVLAPGQGVMALDAVIVRRVAEQEVGED